jgi:hypothetical protein
MKTISSKEDFEKLLRESHAILFVWFVWSGQAYMSLALVEEWEQEWRVLHPDAAVGFYRLNPEEYAEKDYWKLLEDKVRSSKGIEGGGGSLTWLNNGTIVGFVSEARREGKDKLSSRTQEYFGSAAQP